MTSSSFLDRRKSALRAELMSRRAAVTEAERAAASKQVAERFLEAFELRPGTVVAAYWPLPGELDPRPSMNRAAAAGTRLALPRMTARGQPLSFHLWTETTQLVRGPFKVLEPPADTPEVLPDLILAPLLGFDRAGRRLGYGAGFYDRTLAALRVQRSDLLAFGLAFALQEVAMVPAGEHDQRLDGVVTEVALHRFPPGPIVGSTERAS